MNDARSGDHVLTYLLTSRTGGPAPPLKIGLTIIPIGSIDSSTRVATLSGTVTCSESTDGDVEVWGELRQRVDRTLIRGFFRTQFTVPCGGEWSATVEGDNGVFIPGRALVRAVAVGHFFSSCDYMQTSAHITLRFAPTAV